MAEREPTKAQRNAGAFLGPDVLAPVPMRTLSDDYRDVPVDPLTTGCRTLTRRASSDDSSIG